MKSAKDLGSHVHRTNVGLILHMTPAITGLAVLSGCGRTQTAVFDQKGWVGLESTIFFLKSRADADRHHPDVFDVLLVYLAFSRVKYQSRLCAALFDVHYRMMS